jgi:hypothetical protein
MLRAILTALVFAAGLVACGASSPTKADDFALATEFTLAPGQTAKARGADLEVGFVEVTEDSRCPRDVTCVWAGEVKIRVSVRSGSAEATRHEVLESESVVAGGYRVAVVRVEPARVSTRPIAAGDYRATLRVTPEPAPAR